MAILLDEGRYLCSERTMYYLLKKNKQTVVRYQSTPHVYSKPELLATRPNELWSWDITKLKGPSRWMYYFLYVLMDVFSRYVVGWMLAHEESGKLAEALAEVAVEKSPGSIVEVIEQGYRLHEKVLRPARVIVSKGI